MTLSAFLIPDIVSELPFRVFGNKLYLGFMAATHTLHVQERGKVLNITLEETTEMGSRSSGTEETSRVYYTKKGEAEYSDISVPETSFRERMRIEIVLQEYLYL